MPRKINIDSKGYQSVKKPSISFIELARAGEWDKIIKLAPSIDLEIYLAKDENGMIFLEHGDLAFKKKLFLALSINSKQADNMKKIHILLENAASQKHLAHFDEQGALSADCILSSLIEQDITSFKSLAGLGLSLRDNVPNAEHEETFYSLYIKHYHSKLWHYLIDNIDDLAEHGVNREMLLADMVAAKAALSDIDLALTKGVALESSTFTLNHLREYVNSFSDRAVKSKIINTIELFENIALQNDIRQLLKKPHYSGSFNAAGHNIAQLLAKNNFEKECVELLKRDKSNIFHRNQQRESLWHSAIKNDLRDLIRYLISTQFENINTLDSVGLTPWALAITLGNKELARMLKKAGANTTSFVNEQGQTILHAAIEAGDDELINRCFDCGVNVDVTDIEGYTPAYYIAKRNDNELCDFISKFPGFEKARQNDLFNAIKKGTINDVNVLLQNGISPKIKDNLGRSAVDVALIYQREDIAAQFIKLKVAATLTKSEIQRQITAKYRKNKAINNHYKLAVDKSSGAVVLTFEETDASGKRLGLSHIAPWKSKSTIQESGNWRVILNNSMCYLMLMRDQSTNQPDLVFTLKQTGDVSLVFANLPDSNIEVKTWGTFSIDAIAQISKLSIAAREFVSSQNTKMFNGAKLQIHADNINLDGTLSFSQIVIEATNLLKEYATLFCDHVDIQSGKAVINGQINANDDFSISTNTELMHMGQVIGGHKGVVRGHSVLLQRNSVFMVHNGELSIHGTSRVNNAGAIIANQIKADSQIIITNNIGAMIKGISCILHAPQVNQAGFLISGQKTQPTAIDLTLGCLQAGVNVAELLTTIPAPTAAALRASLLVAKTLYRGGKLLLKVFNGDSIQNSEIISVFIENVVPSIGFLSSTEEKATLLVNVLYQFYGISSSEDEFIYKSLECIEALTKTLSICSGGILSEENMLWLQTASKMIAGSRHAIKLAELSAAAFYAWQAQDQSELEKAQSNFGALTEVVFREALYKLAPSELLGFKLGASPVEIVNYILNQGYNSENYIQSIVYGSLHAGAKAGLIDQSFQNDLQLTAKVLFRMKRWQELFNHHQNGNLSTHEIVNESLNTLMVMLSSEKVRAYINDIKDVQEAEEPSDIKEIAEELSEHSLSEPSLLQPREVGDIPASLGTDDPQKIVDQALEKYAAEIPKPEKQILLIDVAKLIEEQLAKSPQKKDAEEKSTILLKSIIEVQKALNGEYSGHGYLGVFASALHNEGIIEVSGDIALQTNFVATNNSTVRASKNISIYGQDANLRDEKGALSKHPVPELINTHFTNFEAGTIEAKDAIYFTCVGLIENFGEIKSLGKITTVANRIVRNCESGRIIAKKDVNLLCDLLARNEGLIMGETVHFEGTRREAINQGTIIGVEKIKLISEKLVATTKKSKTISRRVTLKGAKISKEGALQTEIVTTEGFEGPELESVTWKKNEDDQIGAVVLNPSKHADLDNDAFDKVGMLDVTLKELPATESPLFDISPDFANTFQLHLPQSDRTIPIWQLPKFQPQATFILDAPGSTLSTAGLHSRYDSSLRFIGERFDYRNGNTVFSQSALFDASLIDGRGASSYLHLRDGGLFQADKMINQGSIYSDDILHWNLGELTNDAQLKTWTEYFLHSKHQKVLEPCLTTAVIPGSGIIQALGNRGHLGNFYQTGGKFRAGLEGNFLYYKDGVQQAIATQHGVNPTGILHDGGQNWYIRPEWENAEISSTAKNILIGSGRMTLSGLNFWGDELGYLHARNGVTPNTKSQMYQIDQILSLTDRGRFQALIHPGETGFVSTQDHIASNKGEVVVVAPEGSIQLKNVVLSSAQGTTLVARDEVSIDGLTLDKHTKINYKKRSLLHSRSVKSDTHEQIVYSSYLFIGGELVIRCHDLKLEAVQGVIGSADIVASKTVLSGAKETYKNTTVTKDFRIGLPGNDLLSVLKSHNAKAILSSILNSAGWDQQELESLLKAKSIAEIPGPLLNTARNTWNLSAMVAHACNEFGGEPSDFVGAFTDKIGLTSVNESGVRSFNPRFSFNHTKTTQQTESTTTISTNLMVGGTFRIVGNELHLLDGSSIDAEHLRVFMTEGIKATRGENTYSFSSNTKSHGIGINPLNPQDISLSVGRGSQKEHVSEVTLAELHARGTAQVEAGKFIEGELLISADKGGKVVAQSMNFATHQSSRVLRSSTRNATVSTAGDASVQASQHKLSTRTTQKKAGIDIKQGEVSANSIHLEHGSKIEAKILSRQDGIEGLPDVTGTAAYDHHDESKKQASLLVGESSAKSIDATYLHDKKESTHRPTVIAENVNSNDLPGINTTAENETETTVEKHKGFAVAAFIPDTKKLSDDVEALKTASTKGIHWLFGAKDTHPATGAALPVLNAQESLPENEPVSSDITSMHKPLEMSEAPLSAGTFLDNPLPMYEFDLSADYSGWPDVDSAYQYPLPFPEEEFKDKLVPIYQVSSRNESGVYYVNGRLNIDIGSKQPRKRFSLPSAVPMYDPNPTWNYVFAFCRGVEKARDATTDALLHPIETLADTSTMIWDGYNAIGDLTLGISTEGARERNESRGQAYHEAASLLVDSDSITRTELMSEMASSFIFGGAVSGAPRGIFSNGLEKVGLAIKTNYGYAYQEYSFSLLHKRLGIRSGDTPLYRVGTKGISDEANGQFWATTSPTDPTYAIKYGIPEENVKLIDMSIEGKLGSRELPFITRKAPAYGNNPGGGIEVVVNRGSVEITNRNVPFVNQYRGNRSLMMQNIDKMIQKGASDSVVGALVAVDKSVESKHSFRK